MRRTIVWYLLLVTAVVCCILAAGYLQRVTDPENASLARAGATSCRGNHNLSGIDGAVYFEEDSTGAPAENSGNSEKSSGRDFGEDAGDPEKGSAGDSGKAPRISEENSGEDTKGRSEGGGRDILWRTFYI